MGDAHPKPIRWSLHARERLDARAVDEAEVRLAIAAPEFIVPGVPPRRVFMRRFIDAGSGRAMLLRVVAEETPTSIEVVTVYRTSKIRKYLRGLV